MRDTQTTKENLMRSTDYTTNAPKLHRLGYKIVPIRKGKKYPTIDGWQTAPFLPTSTYDNHTGVGVLCRTTPMVDIDLYDATIAEAVREYAQELLGGTAVERIGQHPKVGLFCRTDAVRKKMISREFVDPNKPDQIQRIEILGDGQQAVAYHIHPDTNAPYAYPTLQLSETEHSALPILTEVIINKIFAKAEQLMQNAGWIEQEAKDKPEPINTENVTGEIPEGKRDATIYALAKQYKQLGFPYTAAVMLLQHDCERCNPAFDLKVATEKLDRVYGPQAEAWQVPNVVVDGEWDSAQLHPQCIVQDYLYANLSLLVGQGSVGKTTLVLYEAVHIVLGRELHKREVVTPGRVMLITAEDEREQTVARLREVCLSMELNAEDTAKVKRDFLISDVTGMAFQLAENTPGGIMMTDKVDQLIAGVNAMEEPPVLLILDPYMSFSPGESSVNDGSQFMVTAARKLIRELTVCVRYVHHVAQSVSRDGNDDMYNARGGTALPDGSRMVNNLLLAKDNEIPVDLRGMGQVMKLSFPKLSYTEPQTAVFMVRRGFSFVHSDLGPETEEQIKRRIRDEEDTKLSAYLQAEVFGRGMRLSKNEIRNLHKQIDIPKDSVVPALYRGLVQGGEYRELELPREEKKGQKTHYIALAGN